MNIYWHYEMQRLVAAVDIGLPVRSMEWTLRDLVPTVITLVSGSGDTMAAAALPAGWEIRLALKAKSDLDADPPLVSQYAWADADDKHSADVDCNTAELIAAIGTSDKLDCLAELVLENGSGEHKYSTQFTVVIRRDLKTSTSLPSSGRNDLVVTGGAAYLYNETTGKHHRLTCVGAAGAVRLGLEQQGVDL